MKILVFGSGALGSLMIHYLCKAGNEVTVVARSTAADLQRNGLVIRHYLQRKTTTDFPKIVETAPEDQNFDIVFSVMQGQQQMTLLDTFIKLKTNILVMVGNNMEADYCQTKIMENRNDLQLLFGFQNSAGHRENSMAVVGRLPVTELFLGGLHQSAPNETLEIIKNAFNPKDYKITPIENMHDYFLCHIAEVMPYAYLCYKVDCNLKKLTRQDIKLIMQASKECFAYLKSAGISVMPKGEDGFYNGGLKTYAMFLLYRLMSKTVLGRLMVSDHCKNGVQEMIYIDKKFDEWRLQHQGLPMPTWDKIKVYLSDNH